MPRCPGIYIIDLNKFFFFLNSCKQSLSKITFLLHPNCCLIIGEKPLLVHTFLGDSHFSSYILFFPLLVPILKNAFRFGPYRYIRNENCTASKQHALLA